MVKQTYQGQNTNVLIHLDVRNMIVLSILSLALALVVQKLVAKNIDIIKKAAFQSGTLWSF